MSNKKTLTNCHSGSSYLLEVADAQVKRVNKARADLHKASTNYINVKTDLIKSVNDAFSTISHFGFWHGDIITVEGVGIFMYDEMNDRLEYIEYDIDEIVNDLKDACVAHKENIYG